jgi:hypothetical protein
MNKDHQQVQPCRGNHQVGDVSKSLPIALNPKPVGLGREVKPLGAFARVPHENPALGVGGDCLRAGTDSPGELPLPIVGACLDCSGELSHVEGWVRCSVFRVFR